MNCEYYQFGGLSENTRVFLSDGTLVGVSKLGKGDMLMSADGEPSEVQGVCRYKSKLVKIEQTSMHCKDNIEIKGEPFGLMKVILAQDQEVLLKTKQRLKAFKKPGKRVIEISELRERNIRHLGLVTLVLTGSRSFPDGTAISAIKDHVKRRTVTSTDGHLLWSCLVQYITSLNKELRQATQILLSPISLEVKVIKPWLDGFFKCNVGEEKVEAMAWLLGFWIGDGHRRGAIFALNAEDHDVNEKLSHCAELLAMKLTIKKRTEEGRKADGVLHTLEGTWNKNSPLTTCLKELKFYQFGEMDDQKNVPSFLRFETKAVRESFIAGLIDSDGCVHNDHGTVKVKIPTAYAPIRDGIFVIGRSLGLSVTVSFEPERDRELFHQRDTWIFHLLSGSNKSVFWSILNRCSCVRKKNPQKLGSCRTPQPLTGSFETTDMQKMSVPFTFTDFGEGDVIAIHLKNPLKTFITEQQLICYSAGRGRAFRKPKETVLNESVLQDDNSFCFSCARAMHSGFEFVPWLAGHSWCDNCRKRYELTRAICVNAKCREIPSENELKQVKDSDVLSCSLCQSEVLIDTSEQEEKPRGRSNTCSICHETKESAWFKIPGHKEESKRMCRSCYNKMKKETAVPTPHSTIPQTVREPVVKIACLSCHATETPQFYRLPWNDTKPERLCLKCYHFYVATNMKCDGCCKVFGKTEAGQIHRRAEKISRTLGNGSVVQGYSCRDCGGFINEYQIEKSSRVADSDKPSEGTCIFCKTVQSTNWRKVPWDKDIEWCGTCRSRYNGTATICSNKSCLKIPVQGELKMMTVVNLEAGLYKCLECDSIARKDSTKSVRKPQKSESSERICHSCGPVTSKRWTKLPWDRNFPAEICGTCYTAFRNYNARCLDDSCGKVFGKRDVDRMKRLKKVAGPSGASSRPCLKCKGATTLTE